MNCTIATKPARKDFQIFAVAALSTLAVGASGEIVYPQTRNVDVEDEFHGQAVADPYRWLEDDIRESEEVAAWVDAQNDVAFSYLEAIPERGAIRERLQELWDYERFGSPRKAAGRYFFTRNDGLQNQSVLFTQATLDSAPSVLLDPNSWSEDGTVSLGSWVVSDDGRYLAYSRRQAGSDWSEWFVREIDALRDLPDRLQWSKFSSASWSSDSRGFFYTRFPAPQPGEEFQAPNTHQKVYYHRVGTSQSADVLVYQRPDQPEWIFGAQVTEDGRYLVIDVWKDTDNKNQVVIKDLLEPYGLPVELISRFDHGFEFIGNAGRLFFFETDFQAPRGRVIAIDIAEPAEADWREVVPEADEAMRSASLVGGMLIVSYLEDVTPQVRVFRPDGSHLRDVEFPGLGSVGGFGGRSVDTETFFSYSSFNQPTSIYRHDLITGESTLWRQPDVDFEPQDYVVRQVFYESRDGTRVPMFVAHREDLELDGTRPTLLYGYGGFNISVLPSFSTADLAWMEMGGVYAQPSLRGGSEYGESWHEAGKKLLKQNVFDDFIAAAEWLIDNGYTRPERLAIEGRSNGGLLVGVAMTQRPELFGAALPAVGVMDMLRYHRFTAGRYWVEEYGSVDVRDEFEALRAYSPYHNLQPGTTYPATLVTTADTDDRVVPGHSFKFAAALQAAHEGEPPVLIRVETGAGHGSGKPTSKRIDEAADLLAFLVETLDFEPRISR